MESKFFGFVWKYSKRDQIIISALTVASFPLVYASLEIPKIIINEAISGDDFPKEYFGFDFEQIPYLVLLCMTYLLLVIAINGLKWMMNIKIGMAGERMLRRMRYMLLERVMRFRITRFRSTRPGEVIQSILGEIEPLGGFFGEVISTPFFQGGLLAVYVTFIFVQDWILGLAAISLYPLQAWLIPKLQRRIVQLNKERAANTRALADTIGESVNVIHDIHTNDTARWHMAQSAAGLYSNTKIRLELFKRKFTIKFINNFMNHLIPFFFYLLGGWLVITGDLDFGSLVAVLAAYKDVAAPWKAVLNYWQRWADFNSRYLFVVEAFSGEDVLEPERIYGKENEQPLTGQMEFQNVEGGPGTGGLTVPALSITPGEVLAVTGGASGAREALLRLAAGLALPTTGRISIGGRSLGDASMTQIGHSIAYIGPDPGIVSRTMRENLLYGLFRGAPDLSTSGDALLADMLREARMTGNSTADPGGDWVDYEIAGFENSAALEARVIELVEMVGLSREIYAAALESHVDPAEADLWTERVMEARRHLEAQEEDLSDIVEYWDAARFNQNATVLENILFARPTRIHDDISANVDGPEVRKLLEAIGAKKLLVDIGLEIAQEFAELIEAVDVDSPVLDSFAGYSRTEILTAGEMIAMLSAAGRMREPNDEQQRTLIRLAAGFIPARDRLDVIDEARTERILELRAKTRERTADRDDFVGFDETRFNPARTIAGNLLSAARRYDRRNAWNRIEAMMENAVIKAGFRTDLIRLGLDRHVNASGTLSGSTRRRIALVRGLIKRPAFLILDGIAGSENAEDTRLRAVVRREAPEAALVYAAAEEGAVDIADRVARISDNGQVRCETVEDSPQKRS